MAMMTRVSTSSLRSSASEVPRLCASLAQRPTPTVPNTNQPNTPAQNQEITAIKNKVEKAVSESGDLISALECVGAMYGIPATNIIADDTVSSIRVVNDNIIAPPLEKANGRTKPIMCAIGSVLDYISQRIDDKLNEYQMNNISQGSFTK